VWYPVLHVAVLVVHCVCKLPLHAVQDDDDPPVSVSSLAKSKQAAQVPVEASYVWYPVLHVAVLVVHCVCKLPLHAVQDDDDPPDRDTSLSKLKQAAQVPVEAS